MFHSYHHTDLSFSLNPYQNYGRLWRGEETRRGEQKGESGRERHQSETERPTERERHQYEPQRERERERERESKAPI